VKARTVTLKARYPDFTTPTRSLTLAHATQSTTEIRNAARLLLEHRLERRGRPLRLVGVSTSGLAAENAGQGTLFAPPDEVRDARLDTVMDEVNERFGKIMRRGGPPGGHRR